MLGVSFDEGLVHIFRSNSKLLNSLIESEQDAAELVIPDLFGHYLLQYSAFNRAVVRKTFLKHHFFASHLPNKDLQVDYECMPFRENSLDCVVAHHILDQNPNAHQCLREAARIVVPNGYLVIIGFNPHSFWGASRFLYKYGLAPKGHYISKGRLLDWLTLLGYRVELTTGCQYLPPFILRYFPKFSNAVDRVLARMKFPGAGVYVLIARKLVAGRTPIRPQWRALSGRRIPVAAPSTRGVSVTSR
ncbi:methyltransferase domain-containing protein [Oceaniserpentilla sp. 4NH20-0058]